MKQTQKTNIGLELKVKNGVLNMMPIPAYDGNHNILDRSLVIWTETDRDVPCALTEKEEVVALRDYLNHYLEEFYD